jgi:hypothetical protein
MAGRISAPNTLQQQQLLLLLHLQSGRSGRHAAADASRCHHLTGPALHRGHLLLPRRPLVVMLVARVFVVTVSLPAPITVTFRAMSGCWPSSLVVVAVILRAVVSIVTRAHALIAAIVVGLVWNTSRLARFAVRAGEGAKAGALLPVRFPTAGEASALLQRCGSTCSAVLAPRPLLRLALGLLWLTQGWAPGQILLVGERLHVCMGLRHHCSTAHRVRAAGARGREAAGRGAQEPEGAAVRGGKVIERTVHPFMSNSSARCFSAPPLDPQLYS